ncbi:MAG: hypothetical protein ACI311_03405 [Bacilli bacterium]
MEVIKFGGTALQTKRQRENVINIIKEKKRPLIVVCSAMGRMGFSYATKTLKSLVNSNNLKDNEEGLLLSCGETISSIVLLSELRNYEKDTRIITCDDYPISLQNDEFILNNFEVNDNDIIVVPGFIVKKNGKLDVLNFGESDLSAVLLAKIVNSKVVNLYKDIDGIYPLFPKLTYKLKSHRYLSYDEALLINDLDYNIVNRKAIEYAKQFNIIINVVFLEDNLIKTTISNKECENSIFGFRINQNLINIGCRFPCKVKLEIEELFKENHIVIKEIFVNESFVKVKLINTQLLAAKRLIATKLLNE